MTASIPTAVAEAIESHTGSTIKNFSFANGGCINNGGKVSTYSEKYFLKWNDLKRFPGMFAAEARGLSLLKMTGTLFVPDVVYTGTSDEYQFLLLEYIEQEARGKTYWRDFGAGLASLHRATAETFGLDHDNYIGSLRQSNTQSSSWVNFFIEQRLSIQLQMALDRGELDTAITKKFDILFAKLPSLLPEEPPSLLHGDLWGGNLMITSSGGPCLIDPAVYYGNREVDLGMTQLFGGFDANFLVSYHATYPLIPGYHERLELYNLYPLLVHVNLFGGGYGQQVISILDRFV